MVDFEGGKLGGFDADNGAVQEFDAGSGLMQDVAARFAPGARILNVDANGAVTLPAGVSPQDITVQGRDLVINLADGTVLVIPDGAIIVPQIVIDGVAIPPATVADLLNGIDPEAGPAQSPGSSGGNFLEDEGAIQDPFDLGDLLPYTELGLPVPEEEEIIPDLVDEEPEIVIITPDNPVGVENAIATVDEDGLPERGEGPTEPPGTRDETNSETTSGTIVFQTPDGLSAILINGVEITTIGQEFVSPFGTLTITSINLATGEIGFSYTLADNTLGIEADGFFVATVRDTDGDEASASLSIIVIDDSPIAADDIGVVAGGTFGPIFGNVLDNDESGADDYPEGEEGPDAVTGFSNADGSALPGESLQGEYGVLTLNADGSYTYTRDYNTPGDVSDVFTYTIIDQDGSTDTATLTIDIGDAPNTVTLPDIGDGTVVDEGGLPPREGEPVGTGEGADADPDNNSDTSEATGSTITFNSPDGLASVTINGVAIDPDNLPQTIVSDATGTLVITGFTYDPVTGDGSITYEYTLGDNTSGDDTSVSFEVVVTDLDGDEAADDLVITIVDDEPEAVDDFASQDSENAAVTVDVFANDIEGADGVAVDTIALVEDSLTGAGTLVNNGDGTFTYTPAPGEEGTVTFNYTIEDGDGDISEATVTIDLLEDSTPEIFVEGDDVVNESGLDGPPASTFEGTDSGADSEVATGVIGISTGGDTIASLVINGTDVTGGGTVAGTYGTLTVTFDGTEYSYSYELDNNIADLAGDEVDSFALTVTDSDGDPANTTLDITVIDDLPDAVDDTDSLTEGGPIFTSGNVITDAEANGDNGADTTGADGAVVQNAGEIAGTYGTLVLGAGGGYTYTLSEFGVSQLATLGEGEFFTEEFDYTLVDGDGDPSPATLTITLNGADDGVTINGLDGAAPEVILDEDDLENPGDDQGSDQTDPLFQNGSFGVTSPDGLDDVQVNGVDVVIDGVFQGSTVVANNGVYSVEITGWTPVFAADGVTVISATFNYTATLLDNTLAHDEMGQDDIINMLTVTATDSDGSFDDAVLDVQIIDDVPTANNDGSLLAPIAIAEDTPTQIDVFANDVEGADGVADSDIALETQATNGTAVYNGDGTFTYTPDAGFEGADSFTYTITDGDGDTSTATVFVNVGADSKPIPNDAVAAVDDDGLGGNAGAGAGDLNADLGDSGAGLGDESVFVGTFTANFGGDAPGTFTLIGMDGTSGMVGTEEVDYSWDADTNTLTATGPRGVLFTVAVNPATGQYTVTLEDNVLHVDDNTNTENNASAVLTFTAIDSEGDPTDATLTITFDDDVPTANDDTFNQADQGGENTAVTGNVSDDNGNGADVTGADSPVSYALTGDVLNDGVDVSANLSFNSDGSFTYTPADGEEGSVTFSYTLTDADGDESTATVTINLEDDSKPIPNDAVAAVDDDGLGGNAGAGAGDLNADLGDSGAGLGDESVFVGTFTANFGGDAPGTFTLIGMDGTSGMVGTEEVDYSWDADTNTLTATGPRGVLFTVAVNPATGQYTVTLEDNVLHVDDNTNTENNASAVLTFTAIDSEGDPTDATLTITFDDDVPTANDDTFNQADQGGENTAVTGNVSTNDTEGADSPVTYAYNNDHDGEGTLDFDSDGSFTYTPADGEEGTVTFSYTLTDADGDESTATVTINLEDDSEPTAGTVTALVDDDGLSGGNGPNVAGDDLDANTDGNNNDIVFVGTMTGSAGPDGPATFSFAGMVGQTDQAGSGSFAETISYTWSLDGNTGIGTLTGVSDVRGDVFTVTLDTATGSYTVTLLQNWLHDGGDDGELAGGVDSLNLTYTVSDSDTPADSADGTLTIQFGDDAPLAFTPDSGFVNDETDAIAPHPTITEALNLSIGADTPAQIEFSVADGTPVMDGNTGEAVSVGSDPLFFYTDPNTGNLVATTGTAWNDGTVGFVVELDATGTGSYTFTVMNDLSNGTTTTFSDLTSTNAGNVLFRGVGVDDPTTEVDVILSGSNSGGTGLTVNTDSDSIGLGNQSMDGGETVRIELVTNLTSGAADASGFDYGVHVPTNAFEQDIPQVQGAQSETVAIRVYALNVTGDNAPSTFDTSPAPGFSDATIVRVTSVTVTENTGEVSVINISGLTLGDTFLINNNLANADDEPIVGVLNSDGSVTIIGLQQGDSYAIGTGANDFEAVAVTALASGTTAAASGVTATSSEDSFDLGIFSIGSFNAGEDIELSFGVTVTDEDGDTADGTINVTVDQDGSGPPPVTPVVLDLDGGGNQFSSLSSGIAYDYDSDGVKTKTAWIAAGSAILAYDMNGDGIVNDASEFVFGSGDMTDLEAIAAKYDDNGDGKLDAADSAYGKFGVWIDGDLDAVSDPGEFTSLADAGITSIDLVSDGIQTIEADGDVTVFGTSSFTWADGSTGEVSDAGFVTGGDANIGMMEALLALGGEEAAANDNSGVVAGLQGAQELPDVAAIVDDVMDGGFVDAMIDHIAGDHGAMAIEASYLDGAAMALKINGDAFAFGANPIADMTEEAAAMVAANA